MFAVSRKACANGDTTTSADLSSSIGFVVKDEGTDFASLALAATSAPLGVIDVAGAGSFSRATIITDGEAFAIAGAAITPGTDHFVMANGAGKVIPLSVAAGVTAYSVGYVMSELGTAAAAGERIKIYVSPMQHTTPV